MTLCIINVLCQIVISDLHDEKFSVSQTTFAAVNDIDATGNAHRTKFSLQERKYAKSTLNGGIHQIILNTITLQ